MLGLYLSDQYRLSLPALLPTLVLGDKVVYHKRAVRKWQTILLAQNCILYHDIIQLIGIKTNLRTTCILKTDLYRYQNIYVLDVFLGKAREIEIRFSMSRKMKNHLLPRKRQLTSQLHASEMATTGIMMGVVWRHYLTSSSATQT
jgi:hypothetical protein